MNKQEWIVGFDLCADYCQFSYFDTEKNEPESVGDDHKVRIPTALTRLYASDAYLAGQEALDAAEEGRGTLITGFAENLAGEPLCEVDGAPVAKSELIYQFVLKSLGRLTRLNPQARIAYLTITAPAMDLAMADAVDQIAARMDIPKGHAAALSHMLSYEYYALSQKRELWTHDVGLFEFTKESLKYHHLGISWKHHPATVVSETTDLTDFMAPEDLAQPGLETDQRFMRAITEVSARRTISTFYLVGEGFEDAGSGTSWMKSSLHQLCSLRRHVFVGQNLYARGACYHSFYLAAPDMQPGFQAVNSDLLTKEIYLKTTHRKAPQKMLLVSAGKAWYNAAGSNTVIVDGCNELIIRVHDVLSNIEQKTVLHLEDLPARPSKTICLKLETVFESESICHITATDMGFGEFFKSSGKVWETRFDLNGIPDMPVPPEEGVVIETFKPVVRMGHVIRMSGSRVYTLEELCWYIYQNVYTLSMDLFDEGMLAWMDHITGSHQLSLAIRNYKEGGRTLKEIVRLFLSSVDYLNNSEITTVFNRLAILEKQNPVEHAKIAADNYCKYGHYMAALSMYHHVAYQMNHDYEKEATRQFKAAVYHNMGVTYLKLHNMTSAIQCLKEACSLEKSESYLIHYLTALQLSGDKELLMEGAEACGATMSQLSAVRKAVAEAEEAYPQSEQGLALKEGLDLKQVSMSKYNAFASEYLERQKKRYDVN